MIDRIEFVIGRNASTTERCVEVIVNGVALQELARRVEAPFAEREGGTKAGHYVGLPLSYLAPPSRVLFGDATDTQLEYGSKVQVLGCECGEPGCWPLVCCIGVNDVTVEWSRFEQPHRSGEGARPAWSHDGLGPFMFDRKAYEAAVRVLGIEGSG